jgi:hypothetical protein
MGRRVDAFFRLRKGLGKVVDIPYVVRVCIYTCLAVSTLVASEIVFKPCDVAS